jgi:hypothetical protein
MPARWSLPSAEQFLRAELPQFIFNPKLPYPRDCYTYAIRLHVYSGTCPWDVEYVGRVLFSHFWMEGCCELIFYHSYTLAGLLRPALKSTRVLHPQKDSVVGFHITKLLGQSWVDSGGAI